MNKAFGIIYFKPAKSGITIENDGVSFCTDRVNGKNSGIILTDNHNNTLRIPFSDWGRRGSLYGLKILYGSGFTEDRLSQFNYQYYCDEEIFTDPYARRVTGYEKWGDFKKGTRVARAVLDSTVFDWEGEEALKIPYEDTIAYGLNVRAFTMHKSSGVKAKGTFEGIIEKIPYLLELGITAVVLMPCYEYEECEFPVSAKQETMEQAQRRAMENPAAQTPEIRVNCWGFKEGFYFAPKASFSAVKAPVLSFKNMVRELHRAGIEVLMQFYFPVQVNRAMIPEVIRFWVTEYHIDGVHLLGDRLPLSVIGGDPLLAETKLWHSGFSAEDVCKTNTFKNLALYQEHFRKDMRCFLKGDEGMIPSLLFHQKNNPKMTGVVNFFSSYDGFSLYDLVSYDKKHNLDNGEDNRDGTDYNYSWNCGCEGSSRKKAITNLRIRQMKNALAILFLSQGTPFLFSGDECANTRYGNNNAYCQDNEKGWMKWNTAGTGNEILDFTKFLIGLRKSHPILHMADEMKIFDHKACGYPDVSYHDREAWRPDLNPYSRTVGVMYCGKYAAKIHEASREDDFFFLAYNMHWIDHKFALPKLPKELQWKPLCSTGGHGSEPVPGGIYVLGNHEQTVNIKERSISIFISTVKE